MSIVYPPLPPSPVSILLVFPFLPHFHHFLPSSLCLLPHISSQRKFLTILFCVSCLSAFLFLLFHFLPFRVSVPPPSAVMAVGCGFTGEWSPWLMEYTGVVMGVDGDECGGTG